MFRHTRLLFLLCASLLAAQETPPRIQTDSKAPTEASGSLSEAAAPASLLPLPALDPTSSPFTEPLDLDRSPDLLPPLGSVPEPTALAVPTVEEIRTRDLAGKVVGSLLSIRVWDEYGSQLASGVGFYANESGLVVTDAGLLNPEFAAKIDAITLTSPDGTNQKVEGFYLADTQSGVAMLQAEVRSTPPLIFEPQASMAKPLPCHVVAVSEKRGLVLAPATIQADEAVTALGWLPVTGQESPGAVGSPVLDELGRVIAIVGMQVPLKSWMNYALDADLAAYECQRRSLTLRPLAALPKTPALVQVVKSSEFLDAFETLQAKRLERALPMLLRLVQKHPRSAECWSLLGLAAASLGGTSESLGCQRKAVALDPKSGLYWHQLALARVRDRDVLAAPSTEDREALELAVERNPSDRLAWVLLAARAIRDQDLTRAAEALEQLLLISPGYAQAHYLMAYVKGRRLDYLGAEASVRQALQLNPRLADAWYYQGLLSQRQGDVETAIRAFQTTARLSPRHPHAWMNLAHALKKAGRAGEGREAFIEHQKVIAAAKTTAPSSAPPAASPR
jgi:cytochrome c-type biogenesis protein CcmH/NrfG